MAIKKSAKSSSKSVKSSASKVSHESLGRWNKWLAALFAVQGVAILIASAAQLYPVTTSYLGVDTLQTQAQGKTILATGTQQLFDINLAYIVAAFLFIAAIAHVLLATKLRPQYEQDLKKGVNKVRWIEYAVSNSLLVLLIGMVVGVQDLSTLLMLFGLTTAMSALLLVMEMSSQNSPKMSWFSYILGSATGALAWIVILIYLISGAVNGSVPAYVYWIAGSAFVLLALMPFNSYLQLRKVREWKDYLFAEQTYMIISFVAKTVVAWLIFASILHP